MIFRFQASAEFIQTRSQTIQFRLHVARNLLFVGCAFSHNSATEAVGCFLKSLRWLGFAAHHLQQNGSFVWVSWSQTWFSVSGKGSVAKLSWLPVGVMLPVQLWLTMMVVFPALYWLTAELNM